MRSLFIVSQICTDPLRHDHDECSVVHVQPLASSNEFIRGVSNERAVGIKGQIRFIEAAHNADTNRRLSDQVDVLKGVFIAAAALVYISPMIFA